MIVLDSDVSATVRTDALAAGRKNQGLTIGLADTMIAGIALIVEATVATGNVKHFLDLGTRVVNPWNTAGNDPRNEC